jgi:hypothetical protein
MTHWPSITAEQADVHSITAQQQRPTCASTTPQPALLFTTCLRLTRPPPFSPPHYHARVRSTSLQTAAPPSHFSGPFLRLLLPQGHKRLHHVRLQQHGDPECSQPKRQYHPSQTAARPSPVSAFGNSSTAGGTCRGASYTMGGRCR